MVEINMSVKASTHKELLEALKQAGPYVTSFYGEVVSPTQAGAESTTDQNDPAEDSAHSDTTAEAHEQKPTPVYSKDEVRAELRKVMQAQGSDAMRQILSKYGCKKLDEANEKDYPAIMKDVKEALGNAS